MEHQQEVLRSRLLLIYESTLKQSMQDQDIYVKWSLLLIMEFGKVKKILKFQLNGQTERLIITKLQKPEKHIFLNKVI